MMDVAPVKSSLDTEIEAAVARQTEAEEIRKNVQKTLRLVKRFRRGQLTFEEYRRLTEREKRIYRAVFGRPKTLDELRAEQKKREKKAKARKAAKQARKRNRRA